MSILKGSNGQLCVTLIWKLVRSFVTQCFQNFKNKSWIRWWNSSETGLGLCNKVPKTNQNFFVCVQMPLVCATLTTHFLFIPSSNASFLFPSDLYKYILPTLQIFEFNEEEQEGQFLQKKTQKSYDCPGKIVWHSQMFQGNCHLSTKFQVFKSKRFNLKLSTTWPSWNF